MHPNNRLSVNAIEAYEIDQFSPEVRLFSVSFHVYSLLV